MFIWSALQIYFSYIWKPDPDPKKKKKKFIFRIHNIGWDTKELRFFRLRPKSGTRITKVLNYGFGARQKFRLRATPVPQHCL
jgi:hypothetical protein